MGCSHATPQVEAKSVDCRRPAPATTSFSHCKSPAGTGPGYHSSKRNWDKGSSDRQFAIPRGTSIVSRPRCPLAHRIFAWESSTFLSSDSFIQVCWPLLPPLLLVAEVHGLSQASQAPIRESKRTPGPIPLLAPHVVLV